MPKNRKKDQGNNSFRRRGNHVHRGGRSPSHKEDRSREWLYGFQPVREMLRAGRRRVETLLIQRVSRESDERREIREMAEERNISMQSVDAHAFEARLGSVNHQGFAAEVSPFRYVSYKKLLSDAEQHTSPLFLFLDHLEDPQNVGSLLRSAEAAGVAGVVIPEHRAVGVTPAVVRASAGAAEHLLVAKVPNLVRCMKLLKERDIRFAGLEGHDTAKEIWTVDLTGALGLVVGSEGRGMRRLVREHCDLLVAFPMLGHVGSLNAGVAGALALYEVLRQRFPLDHKE